MGALGDLSLVLICPNSLISSGNEAVAGKEAHCGDITPALKTAKSKNFSNTSSIKDNFSSGGGGSGSNHLPRLRDWNP